MCLRVGNGLVLEGGEEEEMLVGFGNGHFERLYLKSVFHSLYRIVSDGSVALNIMLMLFLGCLGTK